MPFLLDYTWGGIDTLFALFLVITFPGAAYFAAALCISLTSSLIARIK